MPFTDSSQWFQTWGSSKQHWIICPIRAANYLEVVESKEKASNERQDQCWQRWVRFSKDWESEMAPLRWQVNLLQSVRGPWLPELFEMPWIKWQQCSGCTTNPALSIFREGRTMQRSSSTQDSRQCSSRLKQTALRPTINDLDNQFCLPNTWHKLDEEVDLHWSKSPSHLSTNKYPHTYYY